jgi:hypothetical protein
MDSFSTNLDEPVEIPADLVDSNGNALTHGQIVEIRFRVVGFDGALILVQPVGTPEGLPGLTAVNPAQLTGLTRLVGDGV